MVRIIAGTLIDIGRGKLQTDAFARMLRTKERIQGGITAPPQGLILQRVYYGAPPSYEQYLCEKKHTRWGLSRIKSGFFKFWLTENLRLDKIYKRCLHH